MKAKKWDKPSLGRWGISALGLRVKKLRKGRKIGEKGIYKKIKKEETKEKFKLKV
jgi:hypothetical protein